MRSLSPTEAKVIQDLLANLPVSERQRVKSAGVPRTTYQAIRRRAYALGWVRDRYVPSPSLVGNGKILCLLAQPYAEHWRDAIARLRNQPGTVVLLASPETLFAVTFVDKESTGLATGTAESTFHRYWQIEAAAGPVDSYNQVQAYFDFEGVWSTLALRSNPVAYPRGLPGSRGSQAFRDGPSPGARRALGTLLSRPFAAHPTASGSSSLSSNRFSRLERRILRQGSVTRIVIPDFNTLPAIAGTKPLGFAFVTGEIHSGDARTLFVCLNRDARVSPFLFCYDSTRVTFAALTPVPNSVPRERGSVFATLRRFLRHIEVVREPVVSLIPVIDHRYDRLVEPES